MPFVVRWPGVVEAGRVCDELISQVDLLATVAAIVDFDLPDTAGDDSLNQLVVIQGERGASSPRSVVIHNTKRGHYAIRSGNYVLIDASTGGVSAVPKWFDQANGYEPDGHPAALYRLTDDLGEHRNLIEEDSTRAEELRAELNRVRRHAQRTGRTLTVVEESR